MIYRASDFGYDSRTILEKFCYNPHTLILIKTTGNEIIGAYQSKPRNPFILETPEKLISFNLSNDYVLAENIAAPINITYGNLIGRLTNTIYLCNGSNVETGSMHTLFPSSSSPSKGRFDETKAMPFITEEIEIFTVEYQGMIPHLPLSPEDVQRKLQDMQYTFINSPGRDTPKHLTSTGSSVSKRLTSTGSPVSKQSPMSSRKTTQQ